MSSLLIKVVHVLNRQWEQTHAPMRRASIESGPPLSRGSFQRLSNNSASGRRPAGLVLVGSNLLSLLWLQIRRVMSIVGDFVSVLCERGSVRVCVREGVCVGVCVCVGYVCVCVWSFYVTQYDMLINHSNQRQFCCNRVGGRLLVSAASKCGHVSVFLILLTCS